MEGPEAVSSLSSSRYRSGDEREEEQDDDDDDDDNDREARPRASDRVTRLKSGSVSAYGNPILSDWPGTEPMIPAHQPCQGPFPYLTASTKEHQRQLSHQAVVAQNQIATKRQQLQEDHHDSSKRTRLQRELEDLVHREESRERNQLLCKNLFFENCAFRVLASFAVRNTYNYYAFRTRNDFVEQIVSATRSAGNSNNWFVIVETDCDVYIFLDFEEDRENGLSSSASEAEFFDRCQVGVRFVVRCIEAIYGLDMDSFCRASERTYWLSACTPQKHSFHAHVKIPFRSVACLYQCMMIVLRLLGTLAEACPDHPIVVALKSSAPTPNNPWILDTTVWTKHRNFRLAFQCKAGKPSGRLVPFDPQRRRRYEIDIASDTVSLRKWIKRSLIVLKRPQERKRPMVSLPSPVRVSLLLRYMHGECAKESAASTKERFVNCLEEMETLYGYPGQSLVKYADDCDRSFDDFVDRHPDRRWLLLLTLQRELCGFLKESPFPRPNQLRLCLEELDREAQPRVAWLRRLLKQPALASEPRQFAAPVSASAEETLYWDVAFVYCFSQADDTSSTPLNAWFERFFARRRSDGDAPKNPLPHPSSTESAQKNKGRPSPPLPSPPSGESSRHKKPRTESPSPVSVREESRLPRPLVTIDVPIAGISVPWTVGPRAPFLASLPAHLCAPSGGRPAIQSSDL